MHSQPYATSEIKSMANLDSLGYPSITDESRTDALERLRVLRLNRRTPIKVTKPKATSVKTKTAKAKLALSESDKLELLKLLTGV
jgi:hypothetical protein